MQNLMQCLESLRNLAHVKQHLKKRMATRPGIPTGISQASSGVAGCLHKDNTMKRIISALLLAASASLCAAQDSPLQLADTAPEYGPGAYGMGQIRL